MNIRMSFLLSAVVIFLGILLSGCSTGPSQIIQESQNGSVITIPKGETLQIQLQVQMGTGFTWKQVSDNGIIKASGEPETIPAAEGQPGSIELQVFTYKTIKAGEETVDFEYLEAWKENAEADKSFSVTVVVEE